MNSLELRTTIRWLLWSKDYKTKVLTQPNSAKGELKHIEWDGWGFPGAGDTVVYLVFDPDDSLSTEARAIRRENSAAYPAKSFVFAVWRAIITLFCSTPTPIGATATRAT
jgi:hypothetical protein